MLDVLALIFPVFALVGLGLLAARLELLPERTAEVLGAFVFTFATPCLMFRMIVGSDLPDTIPWGYWLSYFGAIALMWPLTHLIARRVLGLEAREAIIAGFSVGQANLVMVGLPILLSAYGPAAGPPIALLLGLNLPIMMTTASLLLETAGAGSRGEAFRRLGRSLVTHPILIGIVSGLVVHGLGFRLPAPVDATLAMLAGIAVPGMLVALGMTLARYGLPDRLALVVYICLVKLLVVPGLVWVLAAHIFQLPPVYVGAAVVFAAAPVGVNVFVVAQRYKAGLDLASGAIALSTAMAVFSSAMWLWWLGLG
jgi:predicted permease